jgi:uncharacterized protein (TIGR02271 family)
MAHFSANVDPARLVDARVHDAVGHEAFITSIQQTEGGAHAWVQLADGMRVLVPVSLLAPDDEDSFRLPFNFDTAEADHMQMSFPVMEEMLEVDKRSVDTGRGVRIHKHVSEHERVLDQPLRRDELVVEHVAIGQIIADGNPPATRYEGDTLVVPVLEEVLVVQKQLLLKEEVRITRREQQVREPQTITLRSEQVTVERFDESANPTAHPRR